MYLTCRNHPDLRWSCKEMAWGEHGYNGIRHLFFFGRAVPGKDFEEPAPECPCPLSDLEPIAPPARWTAATP